MDIQTIAIQFQKLADAKIESWMQDIAYYTKHGHAHLMREEIQRRKDNIAGMKECVCLFYQAIGDLESQETNNVFLKSMSEKLDLLNYMLSQEHPGEQE